MYEAATDLSGCWNSFGDGKGIKYFLFKRHFSDQT